MADEPITEPGDDIANVEALLRELDTDDLILDQPPAGLWGNIERAVEGDISTMAPATPLRVRRRLVQPLLLAAAVVAVLVAGVVVITTRQNSDQVLATAVLRYEPGFDPLGENASASVSLIDASAGLAITLDESNLPSDLTESADLELWLIEPDANGNVVDLVSLGVVGTDRPESFAVPTGFDPRRYSVVDISVEPHDGNAAHSGRSILRGGLADV